MPERPLSTEQLSQVLQWRYAVKRFDTARKIDDSLWATIEKTMVLTPSSFGLQPWKFLVVRSAEFKSKLTSISWNQSQPADCSHMVVFAALKVVTEEYVDQFLNSIVATRGGTLNELAGYKSVVMSFLKRIEGRHLQWSTNQVYIALGQLLTVASVLGLDACPMEGIAQSEYDRLLELENTEYATVVGCALGYRHPDDKYAKTAKVRFDSNDIFKYY